MPPREIAGPEPTPQSSLQSRFNNLNEALTNYSAGEAVNRRMVAGDLEVLYQGLTRESRQNPKTAAFFQLFKPLVKEPSGKYLIKDAKILDLIDPGRPKSRHRGRNLLVKGILATGILGAGATGLMAYEIEKLRAGGGPPPISYDKNKLFSSDAQVAPIDQATPAEIPAAAPTTKARPTETPAAKASATPESVDPFMEFLSPLIQAAHKKRVERSVNDPEYARSVDPELNVDRPLNIVIFGYGQTFEPPAAEKVIIGSPTIISYYAKTEAFDQLSLTHDIRDPGSERYLRSKGQKTGPIRIDQAYRIGGFDQMRRTLEAATGLSVDFAMSFQDSLIKDIVDQVFQGLPIDIPVDFNTQPFFQDDQKYEAGHFIKGQKTLSGIEVMQFMKALPQNYDRTLERNQRKYLVMRALLENLTSNKSRPGFILNALTFLTKEGVLGRRFSSDFDLGLMLKVATKIAGKTSGSDAFSPKFDRSIYIVDTFSGDGGVQWVTSSTEINPVSKHDLDTGEYTDKAFEIPGDGNPHADNLITGYWKSLRTFIKDKLMATPAKLPSPTSSPTPTSVPATATTTATAIATATAEPTKIPAKESRILYPAELSYPEVRKWIGQLRNSHDAVLTESAFARELAGLPAAKRQEVLEAIADAHAKAIIGYYGDTDAIIGLDPGHGGTDIGSSGVTANGEQLIEKNLTWQISQMIADKIYQQTNGKYTVVMLRPENPNDEDLDGDGTTATVERLQGRKALLLTMEERLRPDPAMRGKNILYMSVHLNGSTDQSQTGTETFWPNSTAVEDNQHRGSSKQLAERLQSEIVAAIRQHDYPIIDRGAKEDPDNRQPLGNSDPTTGPYVALGSPKLDKVLK